MLIMGQGTEKFTSVMLFQRNLNLPEIKGQNQRIKDQGTLSIKNRSMWCYLVIGAMITYTGKERKKIQKYNIIWI